MTRFLKLLCAMLLFCGSQAAHVEAGVKVTAFKGNDAPQASYQVVVVGLNFGTPEYKLKMEQKLVKALSKASSAQFIADSEMFPPIRDYTPQEVSRVLTAQEVDAVLDVSFVDSNTEVTTTHSSMPQWRSGWVDGYAVSYIDQVDVTSTSVRDHWRHKLTLMDSRRRNQVVWGASLTASAGRGLISQALTDSSMVSKTVKALMESGLIPKKAKK